MDAREVVIAVDPDELMSRAQAAYERGEYEEWVESISAKERRFLDHLALAATEEQPVGGLTTQGPTFGFGLFLLVIAVVPFILFDSQPWQGIALANAITHFVTGFAWTMVGTRLSRPIKQLGISIWLLTAILAQILLVLAILFLIF